MTRSVPGGTLRIGHSPDPDDAFMWWPLADFVGPDGQRHTPQIDTAGYRFEHVLEDIQSLNVRAEGDDPLEITAVSIHQYPFIAERYALTSCGASMGDAYGPMIVARKGIVDGVAGLKGKSLALPGERTSAWLTCQLLLAEHGLSKADVDTSCVMFDQIIPRVAAGEFDAGLIIHEGQLTYGQQDLELVVDLGRWWTGARGGLPLPLGGNCVRRDLVEAGEGGTITRVLLGSIEHALANRDEAVAFALNYARDMGSDLADAFVGMYVNARTLDYGEDGREAVRRLLAEGAAAGIVPEVGEVDFIEPA